MNRWLVACSLLLATTLAPGLGPFAAVPVEESVPDESNESLVPSEQASASAEASDAGEAAVRANGANSAAGVEVFAAGQPVAAAANQGQGVSVAPLFHQLQVLQGELQTLRGMVEELRFQIERLAQDQQAQYVDLDQRLMALRSEPAPAAGDAGTGDAGPDALTPAQSAPPPVPSAGDGETEQQAYTVAFNLMKDRAFDESAAAFQQMIETYPNGQFTANGYYWLGELHLAKGQTEMARQNFAQVVNLYASHTKVPDALYKLGVVHHRLGDNQRALEFLDRVQAESPDSSAAVLARSYAAELR